MIVAYDGIRAALNPSGLGNYSRFILDAVERHLPAIEPHVYLPLSDGSGLYQPQGRARLQHPHRWPGGLLARTLWRRRLARRVAADGAAVFHGLSNELPVRLHSHGLRGVVTIHDLIYLRYPQYFSAIDRRLYDRRYRRSVAEADRIIAVSQQTADDLMRYYGAPAGRIDVVGQGCAPFFYEIERRPAPQPLVLYVGAFDPRKNIALIVEAAARLQQPGVQFILAGRRSGYADRVKRLVAELELNSQVRLEFDVSATRLRELFAQAHVFVYPSVFEGFGIPLLEAMAAGVPVVTARRSSLPEVCGEAALYLDQDDPERLADLIREVVDRSDVAAELTARGRLRAREFLPEAIAARIGDVYERMLPGLGAERDVQVQS